MNTFRHDEEQRRQWVQDKLQKRKSVKQIMEEAQISRATLYNWMDEFAAASTSANAQLEEVQESGEDNLQRETVKNASEKKLPIHHAATRHRMLLAALEKVDVDKSVARKLAATLVKRFTLSISQACEITGIDETTYGYKPRKPEVDDRLVQQSIVQLLSEDPSKSFDQCYADLKRKYPEWTRKQIKRVYREGRLYLQRRRTRKSGQDVAFPVHPQRPGAIWNLGCVQLNKVELLLFILDDADAILLNTEKIKGQLNQELLSDFLNRSIRENGKPKRLRVPDKHPFNIREITRWALAHRLSILSLSMGKEENQLEVQGMESGALEQFQSEAAMN